MLSHEPNRVREVAEQWQKAVVSARKNTGVDGWWGETEWKNKALFSVGPGGLSEPFIFTLLVPVLVSGVSFLATEVWYVINYFKLCYGLSSLAIVKAIFLIGVLYSKTRAALSL